MTERIYEGPWEEVAEHAPEFTGRRVRLVVLADEPVAGNGEQTLDKVLAGMIGVVDSSESTSGAVSRASEDETSFGEYLERKHREGHL